MVLLVLITAAGVGAAAKCHLGAADSTGNLLVCERLDINPVPFMIAEVFASNIGGVSTLVGDPPNIIIGAARTCRSTTF